jgi:hypothetical protein
MFFHLCVIQLEQRLRPHGSIGAGLDSARPKSQSAHETPTQQGRLTEFSQIQQNNATQLKVSLQEICNSQVCIDEAKRLGHHNREKVLEFYWATKV